MFCLVVNWDKVASKLLLQLIVTRGVIVTSLLLWLATYYGTEFLDRLVAANCHFKAACESHR